MEISTKKISHIRFSFETQFKIEGGKKCLEFPLIVIGNTAWFGGLSPKSRLFFSFFLSKFSFTDTGDSQDSRERKGIIFIPLCHFHMLTNIQTFTCNFACEMTATYL